jgi:hypothetical protein
MTQTLYAHMNKIKNKNKKYYEWRHLNENIWSVLSYLKFHYFQVLIPGNKEYFLNINSYCYKYAYNS